MRRPRVIPCLLLKGRGLVKTTKFANARYLGDPINIVRIFNDKEVDELIFVDITATIERRSPPLEYIREIATECFMPLCYGGGVRSLEDMDALYAAGVEKIAINSRAVENPALIADAAKHFGSQSVVVSVDVRRTMFGKYEVRTHSGRRRTGLEPVEHARRSEEAGAGEILLTSIDRDGSMQGYDLDLVRMVSNAVRVPVIASGGAGSVEDLAAAVSVGGASAAAAGSLFVFQGPHRAVLIHYPESRALNAAFAGTPGGTDV